MRFMARLPDTAKYTLFGVLFGFCFPIGSFMFLLVYGRLEGADGLWKLIVQAHLHDPLLFVIDSAPFFLGLFAYLAGVRQARLRRLSDSLEIEVHNKTEELRRVLAEAHRANEMIAHLAEHDPLTGLYNRRRFQQELERAINDARRYRHELALLFIDLDGFKHINDTCGHDAGDRYLVAVAGLLRNQLRRTDSVARWGGDEFAVLLPQTSSQAAMEVASKIVAAMQRKKIALGGRQWPMRVSLGIAMFPEHTTKAAKLVAYADAAMYEAKQAGGHCWRMYSASSREAERV